MMRFATACLVSGFGLGLGLGLPGAALGSSPGLPAAAVIGGFSKLVPGEGFGDWQLTELPSVKPARFSVENSDGTAVVRVDAQGAGASLVRGVDLDPGATPTLQWQWRIDRVVSTADMTSKSGDDFAARLYVMFDFPTEQLPLLARMKLGVARWVYGEQVPAAALCYVWANREPVGAEAWSAYTDRVRIIVLRNGDDAVGDWVSEKRNLADDYRRAFPGAPVPVTGIAIAADTDQTGESVTAWFGDILVGR